MCFSQVASFAFGTLGVTTAHILRLTNHSFTSYVHLLFYAGMEYLQFVQYFFVDSCSITNAYLTNVAFLYIWIQPLFYNLYYYYTNKKNKQVFSYNILVSTFIFIWAIDRKYTHLLHKLPYRQDETNSSTIDCTLNGNKHLYWLFALNTNYGLEANYLWYMILICFPALWLDDIKQGIFFITTFSSGIIAAYTYTRNMNETISFWCTLSIPYLLFSCLQFIPQKTLQCLKCPHKLLQNRGFHQQQ
jgi:hypothetical protein